MLNFCLDVKDIKYVVIAWLIPSSTVNTKGHLISKAIYDLLTSSKNERIWFDLFAVKSKKANKSNSSVCFLGEVSRT